MEDGRGEGKTPLEQNQGPLFPLLHSASATLTGCTSCQSQVLCYQLGILYSGNPYYITPPYITVFLYMSLYYSACKHLDCCLHLLRNTVKPQFSNVSSLE